MKGKMRISLPNTQRHIQFLKQFPRISVFHPGREVSFSAVRKAALTVEAAWTLPLFFLAVLSLICMTELYGTCAEKAVRLQEKAETAAYYASLAGEYSLPVIDLRESFVYRPRWYPEALPGVRIAVRARVRPWTGRSEDGSGEETEADTEELVYVTDYESVYHTQQCTYLSMDVKAVRGSTAGALRNDFGEKYHACEKCVGSGETNGMVYITPGGDHFHNDPDCLSRSVRLVRKSEVGSLHLCTRCKALEEAAGQGEAA